MKKFKYTLLILSILIFSCKENPKTEIKKLNTIDNSLPENESEKEASTFLKKSTPFTSKQLLPFLPEIINGYKKTNGYAYSTNEQMATGSYGPTESVYNFSIEDGAGSKTIVKNFFTSYKLKNQGPEGTQYIFTELKDYKTIAFLQPKISRNQISFIYNNRFRISIEGPDSADDLWSYIDFENLKKLNKIIP